MRFASSRLIRASVLVIVLVGLCYALDASAFVGTRRALIGKPHNTGGSGTACATNLVLNQSVATGCNLVAAMIMGMP